jgi:hypothetical protein
MVPMVLEPTDSCSTTSMGHPKTVRQRSDTNRSSEFGSNHVDPQRQHLKVFLNRDTLEFRPQRRLGGILRRSRWLYIIFNQVLQL